MSPSAMRSCVSDATILEDHQHLPVLHQAGSFFGIGSIPCGTKIQRGDSGDDVQNRQYG